MEAGKLELNYEAVNLPGQLAPRHTGFDSLGVKFVGLGEARPPTNTPIQNNSGLPQGPAACSDAGPGLKVAANVPREPPGREVRFEQMSAQAVCVTGPTDCS